MCYILSIKCKLSTAFHPQTDGQTECQNQTLEHYLCCFINYHQDDWVRWLLMAQYVYNSSVHSSTGQVPMEILMGFHPNLQINIEPAPEACVHSALSHGELLKKLHSELTSHLQQVQDTMKKYYDHHHVCQSYAVGDWVLLNTKNLSMIHLSPKLDHVFTSPYQSIVAWGKQSYKLLLPPSYCSIHPVFHVSLLEPYWQWEGVPIAPGPEIVDGEEEWLVEEILLRKTVKKSDLYLTKWFGWDHSHNMWEPREHVEHTDTFTKFQQKQNSDEMSK